MNSKKALKEGYTTGSHATSAFKAALLSLLTGKTDFISNQITLPAGDRVELEIDLIQKTEDYVYVKVTKSDNDDVDVTKGCKIICYAGVDLSKMPFSSHELKHKPYTIIVNGKELIIQAGKGVGIVTKSGLLPPVGFPAINPVPLDMMKREFAEILNNNDCSQDFQKINIVFEIENGEIIAKDTANAKAGVMGGLSILGKTGIVKPISTEAYLDSLKQEISVANQNPSKAIVLTMGNSSLKYAKNHYKLDEECFIEIGNFVFDSLKIIGEYDFNRISIVSTTGKLTKIGQAKKNTNNRYGDVDFKLLQSWLKDGQFPDAIIQKSALLSLVGAVEESLIKNFPDYTEKFYGILSNKAFAVLKNWANELNLKDIGFEILLTDGENLKSRAFN